MLPLSLAFPLPLPFPWPWLLLFPGFSSEEDSGVSLLGVVLLSGVELLGVVVELSELELELDDELEDSVVELSELDDVVDSVVVVLSTTLLLEELLELEVTEDSGSGALYVSRQ